MKRYPIRAAKYLVYLVALFVIMYVVMMSAGATAIRPELLGIFFASTQGLLLIGAVILLSLLYPFFGFDKRTLVFSVDEQYDNVIKVMELCGYKLEKEEDGRMIFKSTNQVKRLISLYEDRVEIDKTGEFGAVISGPRKEVVKMVYRFSTFINA